MKKILKITIFVAFLFFLTAPSDSRAAVKGVRLETNQKITKYDLNGDGKKDTLMIKGEETKGFTDCYNKWKIFINGKVCLRARGVDWAVGTSIETVLYKVSSSRVYLFVGEWVPKASSDIGMQELYQVKGNKLVKCVDFKNGKDILGRYVAGVDIKSFSSKKMGVDCYISLGGLGSICCLVPFAYKSGKWIQQGNSYKAEYTWKEDNTLTANRKLPITAKPGGKKTALSLQIGDKVTLLKVCFKGKRVYAQVSKGGKRGWFMCPKKFEEKEYFEEPCVPG